MHFLFSACHNSGLKETDIRRIVMGVVKAMTDHDMKVCGKCQKANKSKLFYVHNFLLVMENITTGVQKAITVQFQCFKFGQMHA